MAHSIDSGQPFTDEHRQRRSDGAYRWFHVQGLPIRDAESRIVRWCVLQTISMSESARSKRSVRVNVSSANSSTAFRNDCSRRFHGATQYANKRFLDFLGMTTDELAASFVEPIHPDERGRCRTSGCGPRRSVRLWRWFSA